MKLIMQHRVRIPNRVAIIAAILLLGSSFANISGKQDGFMTAPEGTPKTEARNHDKDAIDNAARPHRRGLNLGLLLFRHG